MNETSAAYLNLMNRLASSRAQRLRDIANISGQAQIASSQAWSAVPVQLAQIASNAYDTYQTDKRNAEMIRLRDVANANAAAKLAEDERHNRAIEGQTRSAAEAKFKADQEEANRKAGEAYLARFGDQLVKAGEAALTGRDGYRANRRLLDNGWRAAAFATGNADAYAPLPDEPDEDTLKNIQYAVSQFKGYAPKPEVKFSGNTAFKVNPDNTVEPVYTAPSEQRPVAVDTVDERGRNVRRFVTPKAGDEYPSQPPKSDASTEKPLTKVQVNAIKFRFMRERDALKKTRNAGEMTRDDYNAKMAEISAAESEALGGKVVGGEMDASPEGVGGTATVAPAKSAKQPANPVGRTVTYQGKRYVVTGVDANGNAVLKPL